VTSTKERQQRAAARAKLARQMAQRQAVAKKRRQRQMVIGGAAAVVLVVAGTFWAVSALTDDDPAPAAQPTPTTGASAAPPAEPGDCAWTEVPASEMVVDVGTPPTGEPREGTQTMTVATTLGEIQVQMDLAASPCVAASFSHLASQGFYDGTYCHRMFPGMLQCGDPNARDADYKDQEGIGSGGPSYQFPDQNLPTVEPYYPAGTVAMANSGPNTNGSQFFFIYQDNTGLTPDYSVVGAITGGLEALQQLEEIGHDGAFDPSPGGGHPNEDVIIESLTVSGSE
jgi:peptidyl-prolyl cis-trans isomerase B (cyclophilin B)